MVEAAEVALALPGVDPVAHLASDHLDRMVRVAAARAAVAIRVQGAQSRATS